MNATSLNQRKREAGVSLVELMIALAIGLITVLVIMQVMRVFEARKRTSTGGADGVVNAALGLYTIERDAKNAGYGMLPTDLSIGCEVRGRHDADAVTFRLAPAEVTDSPNGAPDLIRFYGSSKSGVIAATKIANNHAIAESVFLLESALGFSVGDVVMAVPATLVPGTNWCTLAQVTALDAGGASQITHALNGSPLNHDDIMPATGYATGDYLVNLGAFLDHSYSIAGNALTLTETSINGPSIATPARALYPNVVQMQAVYGKDTIDDTIYVVDTWEATAPATEILWRQVRALRVAIVVRSQYPETEDVTVDGTVAATTCNSANPHPAAVCWKPNPAGNGVAINVNIGNATPNWRRFRYRVMETTIPLRNMIWPMMPTTPAPPA